MRGLDFSSWQALLSTFFGLATITLIGVGIRLMVMQAVQQRRERENRQINERLRTLIAAYKTLGGSFTGDLMVDPTHLRDLTPEKTSSERARRTRDAVEAALSDVILLGTEEQVRLAATAANEMVTGKPVETAALVVSLRDFIRSVLDLDPVPSKVTVPRQGPTRVASGGGKKDGGREEGKGGGGGNKGGGEALAGLGGLGLGVKSGEDDAHHDESV
ncbi:MAG: hypothetical protein ACO1OB_28285 [Archangium sp.]